MTFFDCTADLVGQLKGHGQKGMLQIDASLSKISGNATDAAWRGVLWRATTLVRRRARVVLRRWTHTHTHTDTQTHSGVVVALWGHHHHIAHLSDRHARHALTTRVVNSWKNAVRRSGVTMGWAGRVDNVQKAPPRSAWAPSSRQEITNNFPVTVKN